MCTHVFLTLPFFSWAEKNRSFLRARSSPLEFHLHRSQYIRILLGSHPPNSSAAISYANTALRPFCDEHNAEFKRLLTCNAYLPLSRLQTSPYADLASPSIHFDLEPLFAKEYCASLGLSKEIPLRVVGDIGAGGALAKIEKGRRIMRERKSEWSTDELPVRTFSHAYLVKLTLVRSRFPYHLRIGTTPSSLAQYRKSNLQSKIHRCSCPVAMLLQGTVCRN